ncbi:septation protein A [Snodgrassella sp. CFCC 13594]|uniref:septation protein A n=1 Tax=Snodgrassella sp. CFCC 13594 TaxID=1775559 RepID=UPI000830B80D|nr:septation protein A [Snodgrassella sp. CFCC 13594]
MKAAFEFLVVVLFFATYMISKNIILATSVAVIAGIIQAAWCWFKYKKLQTMQWVSLLLIVIFGGATIVFKDAHFIMWKPTVLFWLMAMALVVAQLMGKNILKSTIGKEVVVPDSVWRNLTAAWAVFLIFLGVLNLWVAYHFTQTQWVSYKLFGSTGLLIAFVIAQTFYLSRYMESEQQTKD